MGQAPDTIPGFFSDAPPRRESELRLERGVDRSTKICYNKDKKISIRPKVAQTQKPKIQPKKGMKTDYEDLNSFDASVVITIVIGLSLIMAMGFSQLSFENQADLVKAVPIFDLHDQAQQQLAVIQLMFESSEIFLDRFYVAFTQVAVLPKDTFTTTTRGRVLGALIDLSASTTSGG